MPKPVKKYKGSIVFELDYDSLSERTLSVFTVLAVSIIIISVSNWPYLIASYTTQISQPSLVLIGYTLLYTVLGVLLVSAGLILPYFAESAKPRYFKKITEERRLEINFYTMVSILVLVALTYLILSLQYLAS
ncbi:hypothetical protein ACSU1N_03675 [Thermogladius sp. 4427co]|uniref:hypothetical protein n=1 Tax=Thermogladius sp. 4427co TaxID=3450718 RepID=UPI003F79CB7F